MRSIALKIANTSVRQARIDRYATMVRPIRSEADFRRARKYVSTLMDLEPRARTPEGKALEILATLVASYERKAFPPRATTPLEMIQFYMEQKDLAQSEFARLIGSNRASEFLSGRKTALSLNEIRKIRSAWKIPADFLIEHV
jgi:HTH-type transcriptional regulator/antitoxin HigA